MNMKSSIYPSPRLLNFTLCRPLYSKSSEVRVCSVKHESHRFVDNFFHSDPSSSSRVLLSPPPNLKVVQSNQYIKLTFYLLISLVLFFSPLLQIRHGWQVYLIQQQHDLFDSGLCAVFFRFTSLILFVCVSLQILACFTTSFPPIHVNTT